MKGDYFDNMDFTGTLKTRYDATVNRNWGTNAPITGIQSTTYSVRWTGQVMPAFSETYTFRVTSSDGARLMVNGQVLVNDWKDGASRVRSGTVALQSNVKYDIRLEYYRNATNPGSVKLEWQSPSRTRQVIPQASLFTTGSNLKANLDILNASSYLTSRSIQLSEANSVGILNNGSFLITSNLGGNQKLVALLKNGTIQTVFMLVESNGRKLLNNLIDNLSVDATDMLNVADVNNLTESQRQTFAATMVRLTLPAGTYRVIVSPSSVPGVRPQNLPVPLGELCQDCQAEWINYWTAAFELGAAIWSVVTEGGDPDTAETIADAFEAEEVYLDCVREKCPKPVLALPTELVRTANADELVQIPFTLENTTSNSLPITWSAAPQFDATIKHLNRDPQLGYFDTLFAPGSGLPSVANLQLEYRCPSTATTVDSTVRVTHDATPDRTQRLDYITVRITCRANNPVIAATPNPLELVAEVNQSTSRQLNVANIGDTGLQVQNIISGQSWLTVGLANLVAPIPPSESRTATVTAACGPTVESRTTTLQITSSDPVVPVVSVPVDLKCVNFLQNVATVDWAKDCSIWDSFRLIEAKWCASINMRDWRNLNESTRGTLEFPGNIGWDAAVAKAREYIDANYPYKPIDRGNWATIGGCPRFPWWAYNNQAADWYCVGL
ncbi:MAG: hypothetical protein HC933_07865 [Pleurocapsa sp. SU_196_0]|nr:hypothetical protein [Pleurocapsa sp. SU_196_0]